MEDKRANAAKLDKKCAVCGDKAIGFNFNGLSCESCKAFFRRNAYHELPSHIICKQNGYCPVNKLTRKYCKRCRLNKCFAIGMRKELLWCYKFGKLYLNQSIVRDCELKGFSTNLKTHEISLIHEVQNAIAHFGNETQLDVIGQTKDLIHSLNLFGPYIKKVVKFCKNIAAFKCMKQDDQLIILKPFFTEAVGVWIAFLFDFEKDGFLSEVEFLNRSMFIKLDFFKTPSQIYRKFAYSLKAEMQNDTTLRDLIIAYYLFIPRDGISCQEYIRYKNCVYSHLLERYLQHRYVDKEKATHKYATLMQKIQLMSTLKESIKMFFTEIDSGQILNVYKEIFNLN